ncbi:hypothetical protein ACXJJ3_26770 [Kribbella sp. WER1]
MTYRPSTQQQLYPSTTATVQRQARPSYRWPAAIASGAIVAIAAVASYTVLTLDGSGRQVVDHSQVPAPTAVPAPPTTCEGVTR